MSLFSKKIPNLSVSAPKVNTKIEHKVQQDTGSRCQDQVH